MPKTPIQQLDEFGQSIWLDNINRSMIKDGRLKELIDLGLRGMTSNPTIFDRSIRLSNDYDKMIEELRLAGKSTFEIYDELTVKDVQDAADIFRPIYESTSGMDGYVSLEVNPGLAFNTEGTITEAKRLFKKVNRPNVMFKVPATDPGFAAVEKLLSESMNINITLIFSMEQYRRTAEAFLKGMAGLQEKGRDLSRVRSVASVFVSRIDSVVDKMIDEKKTPESLKGKAAVANSRLIFQKYIEIFSSERSKILEVKGPCFQRVLWASTSTKNPAYSDIKYVAELIGRDTVNTMPENTFNAFLDHGIVREVPASDIGEAQTVIDDLKDYGIDIDGVCARLLRDGVAAFEKSFDALLDSIEKKSKGFIRRS